jgi:hypothetical protein
MHYNEILARRLVAEVDHATAGWQENAPAFDWSGRVRTPAGRDRWAPAQVSRLLA